MFSQNSVTSPLKARRGGEYRSELLDNSEMIYKWLSVLYNKEQFSLFHGWTKEMSDILFREVKHGRLNKTYLESVKYCSDVNFEDCLIPNKDMFEMVLNSPVFQRYVLLYLFSDRSHTHIFICIYNRQLGNKKPCRGSYPPGPDKQPPSIPSKTPASAQEKLTLNVNKLVELKLQEKRIGRSGSGSGKSLELEFAPSTEIITFTFVKGTLKTSLQPQGDKSFHDLVKDLKMNYLS